MSKQRGKPGPCVSLPAFTKRSLELVLAASSAATRGSMVWWGHCWAVIQRSGLDRLSWEPTTLHYINPSVAYVPYTSLALDSCLAGDLASLGLWDLAVPFLSGLMHLPTLPLYPPPLLLLLLSSVSRTSFQPHPPLHCFWACILSPCCLQGFLPRAVPFERVSWPVPSPYLRPVVGIFQSWPLFKVILGMRCCMIVFPPFLLCSESRVQCASELMDASEW